MTNYCKACGRLRQIARDGFCGGCADADTIAALQRENAKLWEALVDIREALTHEHAVTWPTTTRKACVDAIDAALTPSAAPGEDSGEDARG